MSSKSPDHNRGNFKEWVTIGLIALLGVGLLGVAQIDPEYVSSTARFVLTRTGVAVLVSAFAVGGTYALMQAAKEKN